MKYRTIVADPPWPYAPDAGALRASRANRPNSADGESNTPAGRYPRMLVPDLIGLSVRDLAAEESHLYLWTTNAFIYEAHDIMRAWGFKPKTICTWGKVKACGRPSMKMGHWFRGATEHCLFGVRGRLRFPKTATEPTLWLWPRLPHSVKPGAFYDLVERVSPAPRLELFARTQRLGWDTWGHEALNHINLTGTATARSGDPAA